MGRRILRAETAALALAAVWHNTSGDMGFTVKSIECSADKGLPEKNQRLGQKLTLDRDPCVNVPEGHPKLGRVAQLFLDSQS